MDGVCLTNLLVYLARAREVRGPPHWCLDAEAQWRALTVMRETHVSRERG